MKKYLSILCVIMLAFILPHGMAAENLTPIESVEWGQDGNGTSPTGENNGASGTENMDETDTTSQQSLPPVTTGIENLPSTGESGETGAGISKLPLVESPQDLLQIIKAHLNQVSAQYYLINYNEGKMTLDGKALTLGPNAAYLTYQKPPYIPVTLLVQSQDNQPNQEFIPMETLTAYVSDALNSFPNVYAGTIVEEMYVYAQKNYPRFQSQFVKVDENFLQVKTVYEESVALNHYWVAVLEDFFKQHPDLPFVADKGVDTLMLQDDLAGQFTEIAQSHQADFPELSTLFANFQAGFEGTLSFDYQKYQIGLGLLSIVDNNRTDGIELYIQPVEAEIKLPEPGSILTMAEFRQQFGKDFFTGLDSLNATLKPEQFESEAE